MRSSCTDLARSQGRSNNPVPCANPKTSSNHPLGWEKTLYIKGRIAPVALPQLLEHRQEIEREIGHSLSWNPYPDKRDKIIVLARDATLDEREQWPTYIDWMVDMTRRFWQAFAPRVRALDLTAILPEADEDEGHTDDAK